MNGMDWMRVSSLMCSRLCHDLVGPVGGIVNGVEFLADDDSGMREQAVGLLADSARKTARRLQYYRLAFGAAGDQAGELAFDDIKSSIEGYFEDEKIAVAWRAVPEGHGVVPKVVGRLLLNLVILAAEHLPRGGGVTAMMTRDDSGDWLVSAAAKGAGLTARPAIEAALAGQISVEDLDPRNVTAFFAAALAEGAGGSLRLISSEAEGIEIKGVIPATAWLRAGNKR